MLVTFGVTACGGGGGKNDTAAAPTTTRATLARPTTSAPQLAGPPLTAEMCPTAAELQEILKSTPTEIRPPRASPTSVACDFVWGPSPTSSVTVAIYRFENAAALERSFSSQLQDDQDEAAGKTLTAHKTGPGSVTAIQGLGDQAYVHMEQVLDYHTGPGTWEVRARAGTLMVTIHIGDTDKLRFGPPSGTTTQAVELAKLAIRKAG
jgi:hypothetical protein